MNTTPQTTAFLFPGQGSQSVGMGYDLAKNNPRINQVFETADNLLGFPLSQLIWQGPQAELDDTLNTQPALLTHSVAVLRLIQARYPGYAPLFVAGHSMGELSALVAAGALPFEAALLLARKRGELMKKAGQLSIGGMAAIMGLDIPTLERLCIEASVDNETVNVANDNCPGQVVISGAKPALERAIILAQRTGARRAIPLAVSIAAHSPLMTPAQEEFNEAIDSTAFTQPEIPLIGNVSARSLTSAEDIRLELKSQLTSRVRWTESIQAMIAAGVDTFFEIGNGSVLAGLVKRIDSSVKVTSVGNAV